MNEIFHTDKAPAALGPYSQAVKAGNLLFVSGQIPIDPATGNLVEADIAVQTKRSLMNIEAILEAAGYTCADVVKTTVLLSDIANFAAMNEVYGTYFPTNSPARACFAVKDLPKGAMVEIEVIASK